MRRTILVLLMPLALFAVRTVQANPNLQAPPDRVVVVGNHAPPYRIISHEGFSGIYFDTMKEIAERIGVEAVFMEAPFQRALALMKTGQADIMLGPNRTEEREAYMVYTRAVFPAEDKGFFLAPGKPDIARYEDLFHKTVCVHLGKSIDPRFDTDPGILKRDSVSQLATLQDALTNKCDAAVLPAQEARWLMAQLGTDLDQASLTLPGRNSYLTLSRNSPVLALQPLIEDAMRSIMEDGTFERILERYR